MNEIIQKYIGIAEQAIKNEDFWYSVKQYTRIDTVCRFTGILEELLKQDTPQKGGYESYAAMRAGEIGLEGHPKSILLGCYLGLCYKGRNGRYDKGGVTPVFEEICTLCNRDFKKISLYQDILDRQIEKIFLKSPFEGTQKRNKFKIYPTLFLYKILLEIGSSDKEKEYSITKDEYNFFLALTTNYKNYPDIVKAIQEFRNEFHNSEVNPLKVKYKDLASQISKEERFHRLLEQLSTIEADGDEIKLKSDSIPKIRKKINFFEKNYDYFNGDDFVKNNYMNFLCSDVGFGDSDDNSFNEGENSVLSDLTHQKIFFGAPGTGKSFELAKEAKNNNLDHNYRRVIFYPSYLYSNFVGTYKPYPKDDKITYEFVAGPLLELLISAILDESQKYLLIIEEINRADVSSVFGDIFQLLDRDGNGFSEYGINMSREMRDYVYQRIITKYDIETSSLSKESIQDNINDEIKDDVIHRLDTILGADWQEIRFPSNFYIWATMNSADQGVKPMDSAFKRRWNFEYIDIDKAIKENKKFETNDYNFKIGENDYITWNDFRQAINKGLIKSVPEDKLLGPYFIPHSTLEKDEDVRKESIIYKVLMYLFEDVHRAFKNVVFKNDDKYKHSFSAIISDFNTIGYEIFTESIRDDLKTGIEHYKDRESEKKDEPLTFDEDSIEETREVDADEGTEEDVKES